MEIRQAILSAADHIERNPGLFRFSAREIPDCGTPGCALGWIGHFLGAKVAHCHMVATALNCPRRNQHEGFDGMAFGFYDAMDALDEGPFSWWRDSAPACARNLRLYADKYHPATEVGHSGPTPHDATTLTVPKYDWNDLAERLAREPQPASSIPA